MKKMKRILSLVLVLVMAAGLAACGGGGASGAGSSTPAEPAGSQGSGEGYELTMWLFQDWTVGTAAEIFNTWADEYIAQHPEVKSITFVGKPDTEIVSGFMAGGSLPDMFAIQFLNGKRIVESANILNLQPYYDAAPEEYKNALNADAMKDLMTNPEGTCWGLPFTANCQLLYRNLTVLEACGVDTSKRPETLDELLEQFAAVQENGYDVLPNLMASDWVTSAFVCGNPDLKVGWENGETTITAEALEPGYELLKEVGQYSAAYTFLDQAATDAFTSDKLAFTVHGPFLNPNLEAAAQENSNFKYDAIPMPSQVAGGPYSASYGNEWLGVVDSGDQGRNDAAAGFLMYITDTEQMKTFCREMGRPVMNNDAMDEIANDPESPWLLSVCNEIVNNCVNQAVPFRCDMMWETGCADSMFGLWDGSLTDAKAAAEDSIAMINENA
ncbi:hypothetical protein HMPREF1032_00408 [Subdoligranulum sp. 4_3_54A2FAA]|nr:hypothetical protein HMPREF1032_00408 [Subdoligranulum sp. 4_3_54A2FAA]